MCPHCKSLKVDGTRIELKKRRMDRKGSFTRQNRVLDGPRGFLECSFSSISSTKTFCDRQILLTNSQCCTAIFFFGEKHTKIWQRTCKLSFQFTKIASTRRQISNKGKKFKCSNSTKNEILHMKIPKIKR